MPVRVPLEFVRETMRIEHVAELIEVDQVLASQLLRLANSAFYGSQGKISEVRQAFPAVLAEPIRYHHHPGAAEHAVDETAIVHVANTLVRACGYGSGGDDRLPAIDPDAWARLALDAATLDAILDRFHADLDHALNYAFFE